MWQLACLRCRTSVYQTDRSDAIAGKPAPTLDWVTKCQTQKNANPRVGVFVQRLRYHCGFLRPKPGR